MQIQPPVTDDTSTNFGVQMPAQTLPGELPHAKKVSSTAAVQVREPNRHQVELRAQDLESLIAQGHRARLVWDYVFSKT